MLINGKFMGRRFMPHFIPAFLRKQGSEESQLLGRSGMYEGRGGPTFPPENHAISLSLYPTLVRHFPLVSHSSGSESFSENSAPAEPTSAVIPS